MSDIDRRNPGRADSPASGAADERKAGATQPDARIEHHLRGAELDDDFTDADQDSCTSTRHRDDRESDS